VDLIPKYSSSFALVVGINAYKTAPPLGYAVSDATAVAGVLTSDFSFPKENVHLLLDDNATGAAIRECFLSFARDGCEVNDRLVVFFAGHGHTVRTSRAEVGYLVPWDGDCENLASLIRWDNLTRDADLIEAKHLLFVMDACYGGLAITRALKPGSMRFMKDMLLRRSRQVLTAGKADEVVADLGGPLPNHSVFTGHFLEALAGKAASPDGMLTANGVISYVYRSVANDADSQQTPHFGYLSGDGDLIFTDALLASLHSAKPSSDPLIPEEDVLSAVPGVLTVDESKEKPTTAEQAKELLSEERLKIKLHDLVSQKTREMLSATADDYFPVQGRWSNEEFVARLKKYEAATNDLLQIQSLVGYWGETYHRAMLTIAPQRLASRLRPTSGLSAWLSLRYYPLLLMLYCGGIAAVAARRYDNLRDLLLLPIHDPNQSQDGSALLIRSVARQTNELNEFFKCLPGHERQYTPRSEYLLKLLQPILDDALFLGTDYEASFDRFEVFYALEHAHHYSSEQSGRTWGPVGRFGWKESGFASGRPFHDVVQEAEREGASWLPFENGLFGGSIDRFKEVASAYGNSLSQLAWS
jgi:uncharacterized caspase-like protein